MRKLPSPVAVGSIMALTAAVTFLGAGPANAAQPPVGLGVAHSFAVLAHSTVTNTGPSVVHGSVGVSPGTAITGFTGAPKGKVLGGTIHRADALAANAQDDLTLAYNDAAGRTPNKATATELGGRRLVAGVYRSATLGVTGTLTLDAKGNPDAVWVFKASSTLITASSSVVALVNGASPCNVYWQIGSSATLGTDSVMVGTVMALASISANTSAVITGRLFARTGAVTLDSNVINRPQCTTTRPSSAPSSSTPGRGGGSSTAGRGGGGGGGGGNGSSTPANGGPGVPLRAPGTGTATNATPSGPSTTPGQQPPRLARTGSDNANLAIAGVVAIVLGGSMLLIARRRIPHSPHRH
jgi:LPXTG-motif cell wall-anchored protein